MKEYVTDEQRRYGAEMFRDFLLFFGVLFFTCVVGIIGLLPEFEKTNGLLSGSWLVISIIYFGLLFGICYSIHKCFFIYWEIKTFAGRYGFRYPEIESIIQRFFKKNPKYLEGFLIFGFALVFFLLYMVKIGLIR